VTTPLAAPPGQAEDVHRTRPPWWVGAILGLVSAWAGLAVAELVSGIGTSLRSPVISVGDRVVDGAPRWLKTWAIDTFGTADKAVLLAGVAVLLALFAVGIGTIAVRRGRTAGLIGVAIFAGIGAAASLGRGSSGWWAPIPSVVGGVVAGAVLVLLMQRGAIPSGGTARNATDAPPTTEGTVATPAQPMPRPRWVGDDAATRRQFLGTAAAITLVGGVAAATGRWLRDRGVAAAQRLTVVLPRAAKPLPEPPAGVDLGVEGNSPFFTPNDDFYRIDTALTVPSVDLATWTLKVTGDVDTPITLSYQELLDRPMVEADITLACVSNEIGGDLVGNARWLGCRLDDLLAEAGIGSGADQVVGRSVDGFTAGFPTAMLDGRDALVAIGMNGEPLPAQHGFPARLVVPGLYGYVSATKWLAEIELTTFDAFEGYWIPRGWAVEGPIKTQSRIVTPRAGGRVPAGTPGVIAGVAWAPTRGISKVEVSIDGGPWREATLGEQYESTTWRQWMIDWTPAAGRRKVTVRATDGEGETQTDVVTEVAPDGASGWQTASIHAV
jgi:DMSO/TMAO reductase YedYZ molybdopterin-dependent catalytic subunit